MFDCQGIKIEENVLHRFIYILEFFVNDISGIGNYLFFEKKDSEKNIIGYDFFINFKNTSYYLFSINKPQFKKNSKPGFYWTEYRRYFLSSKINFIDLIGVNSPNRGKFKTSLGSLVVPYWYFATE